MTCVVNDLHGLTHSPASSDHYFHVKCFVLRHFEKLGWTDAQMTSVKIMITTPSGLWNG